jgi:uncharacterized membrane protein
MPQFAISLVAIPLLGAANGLRTLTPIAVLCWMVYGGYVHVDGTWAFWTGDLASRIVFTVLAIGEYIGDKLPQTPNRTAPFPLGARMVFGGLVGAIVATSVYQPLYVGIALGSLFAILGAFAGFHLRRLLTVTDKLPGFPIAVAEDAVTIGLSVVALLLVA